MRRAWIGAGGLLVAALVVGGASGSAVTRTPDDVAAGISLQQSASARIEADGKTIYFDPLFDDKTLAPPADLILITHAHDRHCSAPTILRILKADTAIVAPESCARLLRETHAESITTPVPGKALRIAGFTVESVPAYTPDHADHPLAAGGVGYVLTIDGVKVYHSGSTALVPELKALRADVALMAFWNGYILSTEDAATLARSLGAKIVIPIHCKPEEAVKLRHTLQPAIRVVLQDQPAS
jgi:L-ascorbate metabolism protein UlaG (beta-lactamase superfamily)